MGVVDVEREQFDRLSRLVARAATRREALRLLVSGVLVGMIAGAESAAARKRSTRKPGKEHTEVEPPLCPNTCNQSCNDKPLHGGVNLMKCDLNERDLAGVNLAGANLTKACFGGSSLRNANLRGTNVSGACFCGADLRGTDFRGSNVTQQQLACATVGCTTILPNGKKAVCRSNETCCDGTCTDTQTDPLNCGSCGTRCQINGICDQGHCGCMVECPHYALGFQCCASDGISAACSCGVGGLTDPLTCDFIPEDDCPPAQRCIAERGCKTCCPPDSDCDPSTGTCLLAGRDASRR
jgi:hypothetical protein